MRPGRRVQDRLGDQGLELLKGFRGRVARGRHGADDVLALCGRQILKLLPDGLGAADLQQFQHASGHDPGGLLRGGVLGLRSSLSASSSAPSGTLRARVFISVSSRRGRRFTG
jgi:hypothetical protein